MRIVGSDVMDCARSLHPGPGSSGDPNIPGVMNFDLPDMDTLPSFCKGRDCILRWNWEGTDVYPSEFFNNNQFLCSAGHVMHEGTMFGKTVLSATGASDMELTKLKKEAMKKFVSILPMSMPWAGLR